jgi:hypothetical protein
MPHATCSQHACSAHALPILDRALASLSDATSATPPTLISPATAVAAASHLATAIHAITKPRRALSTMTTLMLQRLVCSVSALSSLCKLRQAGPASGSIATNLLPHVDLALDSILDPIPAQVGAGLKEHNTSVQRRTLTAILDVVCAAEELVVLRYKSGGHSLRSRLRALLAAVTRHGLAAEVPTVADASVGDWGWDIRQPASALASCKQTGVPAVFSAICHVLADVIACCVVACRCACCACARCLLLGLHVSAHQSALIPMEPA